uniref:NADH-ubiquinone oxidoreductase chain 5 n=1 Tax=Abispa ephippium TaxID=485912 RepID=B6RQY6_9HYME|nr:NADH dehydrogenase subunit 5 [Abispa ephippium]
MIYYSYIYFLMMFSLMTFLVSLYFLYYKLTILLTWVFYQINSMNMEMMIYLDWISLMFLSLVSLISGVIIMYSMSYMKDEVYIYRFIYLMLLFVLSMYFLIISPSMMSLLLGWDGLGLVSYCLVIYYQSWKSFNSGMVTVLSNRVGDVGILMMISMMMILGSWNLLLFDFNYYLLNIFLVISVCTKSAQLPFSVWLPMAMAAPTPVSALVHSSTLVTAGVYLLIRFNMYLIGGVNKYLLLISSLTMFMAGFMANFENDLKKIIALSTLSQLGLMMSILSMGMMDLGFFHLIMHAMFKSLLFMCSGMIIHQLMNNQDIRFMGSMIIIYPYLSVIFFFSSMSLCGFPFLSGFYSKDMIMEVMLMSKMNLFSLLMLLMSTMLTVSYSVRLIYLVFLSYFSIVNCYYVKSEDKMMSMSMIIMFMMSVFGGKLLVSIFLMDEIIFLSLFEKLLIMQICFLGVLVGVVMCNSNMMLVNNLVKDFCWGMFGLSNLFMGLYYYPLKWSFFMNKEVDKGILENILVKSFELQLLKKMMKFFLMKNMGLMSMIQYVLVFFFFFFFLMMI